jgi:hypothetical protein
MNQASLLLVSILLISFLDIIQRTHSKMKPPQTKRVRFPKPVPKDKILYTPKPPNVPPSSRGKDKGAIV